MGKRKKNRGKSGSSKPPQLDLDYNPFAGLKGQRDEMRAQATAAKEAEERARVARAREAEEARQRARPMVAAEQYVARGNVQMTDEEMFEAAVKGLDRSQVSAGKYGDGGPLTSHVLPPKPEPPKQTDPYGDADDLFAREFGGDVRRVEDKYFVAEAATKLDIDALYKFRQRSETAKGPSREALLAELLQQGGPSLSRAQIQILEQGQRREKQHGKLPVINLRGMSQSTALHALENGIGGRQYLRVITGKGLQSAGEPVLKKALVVWCLSHGVGWAPELYSDGTFGSFVIHKPKKR